MANNDKWSGVNPWLGLASYTEGTPLYGRDKETIVLADIIKNNLATIVFGKSGVGKSSLIGAGISPALREELYIPIKIRLVHNSDVSYIEQIEDEVRKQVNCTDLLPASVPNLGLWDFFHRHSFTRKEDGEECTPVVILDQFEEIYTLTDEAHKLHIHNFFQELSSLLNDIKPDQVIEKEREFASSESTASSVGTSKLKIKRVASSAFSYTPDTNFRFVICLREDKLYLLERNSTNIPALKNNRFNLQALSEESATEVIMRPRPDLFTDADAASIIDKLADMGDEGVRTVDPAILSLFLYKYYEKQGTASADNIFADYYSDATRHIGSKSIAFLENHLLTLGGYRNQIPLDDALSTGVTPIEIDSLLESVILRTEKRKGIDYIEFSHDRLCAEAKKNREERTVREQEKKAHRNLMLSFAVFFVSGLVLALISYFIIKVQEQKLILVVKEHEIHVQNDSLKLSINERNRLECLNKENQIQKIELEKKSVALANSLEKVKKQNQEMAVQLALIESQQKTIEEQQRLLYGVSLDSVYIVRNNYAGKLSQRISNDELLSATSLTITGEMNEEDVQFLQSSYAANRLKILDICDVRLNIKGKNQIAESMFSGAASLSEIHLPRGVQNINARAFFRCKSLESIVLPNEVRTIGMSAFEECTSLKSISIPTEVYEIEPKAFSGCRSLTSVSIPNNIQSISQSAFSRCRSLTTIKIPDGVSVIAMNAFSGCSSLSEISIPNSVTSILVYAFSGCTSLKTINIPPNLTSINAGVFSGCKSLISVNLPSCIISIGENAFEGCKSLSTIQIPDSVTYIGKAAFSGCYSLHSIKIPSNVNRIESEAFKNCSSLEQLYIPDMISMIEDETFAGCNSLVKIDIPKNLISIGKNAFGGCYSLSFLDLPEGIMNIGKSAFADCRSLKSVSIPSTINYFEERLFYGCVSLSNIESWIIDVNNVPAYQTSGMGYWQFDSVPPECIWHVPVGTKENYMSQPWWISTWTIIDDLSNKR